METMLILGAGLMQRSAIEAAKEEGYFTLVVDANPNAVCVPYADRFEKIDLKNKDEILKLAQTLGSDLKGVFTCSTDFSESVSYVAQNLGLVSHTLEAARNASNKLRMRKCFQQNSLSSPSFSEVTRQTLSGYLEGGILNSTVFPKVIKPQDNMGARGCRIIRRKEEFLSACEDAIISSRTGRAILEDYMEGPEFSIDALVHKGTLTITGFADRHIFYQPYFIEMGHTMSSNFPKAEINRVIECFAKGVKALGLSEGAAKGDIKLARLKSGEYVPMIGEIAGRLSGGYMSGWTFPYASGLNLTKEALLIAAGKEPQTLEKLRKPLDIKGTGFDLYEVECGAVSAERAFISIPGIVKEIYGRENAEACPYVKNLYFRVKAGDRVDFPRNNVEKCGNVITLSNDYNLAVESAASAVSKIVLRLEPSVAETEKFLLGKVPAHEKGFPPDAFQLTEQEQKRFMEFLDSAREIPENKSITMFIPKVLEEIKDTRKDWNNRTIAETVKLFDDIRMIHPKLDCKTFWKCFVRGGIQGALYMCDSKW